MRGMERCLIVAGLAFALACAPGCSRAVPAAATTRPTGPVHVTDVKQFHNLVGQQVNFQGTTVNGTGFAAIKLHEYPVFIRNLSVWAPAQLNSKMEITGVLVQQMVAVPGQQLGNPVFMLDQAKWQDPTPPPRAPGSAPEGVQSSAELAKLLGTEVKVEGKARNDKVGAAIQGNGLSIYLYPSKKWPTSAAGKRVEVTGKLIEKPAILITPRTTTAPAKYAPAFFIDHPVWKVVG